MSVVILDFGSQFTRLIARRFRELGAYSVILPGSASLERIRQENPQGIVLSGGPSSVYDENAPKPAPGVLDLDIPILGVCYGMQFLAQQAGGNVKRAGKREYGKADLTEYGGKLFEGIEGEFVAWMSHSDSVTQLPQGYAVVAKTEDTPVTAIENNETRRYGVQFHPEVVHTPKGGQLLANFLDICGVTRDWNAEHIVEELVADVQKQVGNGKVLLAISGGVDSSTLALLLAKAVGERLTAVFIDHGLLRLGEREQVEAALKPLGVNLVTVDARQQFLGELAGVDHLTDPALKGHDIGVVAGTPPATHMARAGLAKDMRGWDLFVDRRVENPVGDMLTGVRDGTLDAAVLWGPLTGPLVKANPELQFTPLLKEEGGPKLFYRITMGVRLNEQEWKRQLNSLIRRNQPEIDAILRDAGVPLVDDYGKALKP